MVGANLIKLFLVLTLMWGVKAEEPDPNGYLAYCPCMGRFGNQADHFLGTLAFAKALNRTLILPPWIEYKKGEMRSLQIPFDKYFQVEPLKEYHRVILMADFMKDLAPAIWPEEKRVAFCYKERISLKPEKANVKDCHAKDGNPFGPFWDEFQVDFVNSEFYAPLHFEVHHSNMVERWQNHYPASKWPVLAFTGAPASFPVQSENRGLQRYLKWSKQYQDKARDFIKNSLPKGAFIGIHLRNGIDWVRACEHIKDGQHLFASPQCLGYSNEKGSLYPELCMQTKEMVIRQLKRTIKNFKQIYKGNDIRSVFVASDSNHMINELSSALSRMEITVHKLPQDEPYLDLGILGISNHFIGNCISSYTAFVKRERDVNGFPSTFWGFPKDKDKSQHKAAHEEL